MTSAAQLYDAVLAYAVALTNLYNKGDVNKVWRLHAKLEIFRFDKEYDFDYEHDFLVRPNL